VALVEMGVRFVRDLSAVCQEPLPLRLARPVANRDTYEVVRVWRQDRGTVREEVEVASENGPIAKEVAPRCQNVAAVKLVTNQDKLLSTTAKIVDVP